MKKSHVRSMRHNLCDQFAFASAYLGMCVCVCVWMRRSELADDEPFLSYKIQWSDRPVGQCAIHWHRISIGESAIFSSSRRFNAWITFKSHMLFTILHCIDYSTIYVNGLENSVGSSSFCTETFVVVYVPMYLCIDSLFSISFVLLYYYIHIQIDLHIWQPTQRRSLMVLSSLSSLLSSLLYEPKLNCSCQSKGQIVIWYDIIRFLRSHP